MRKYELVIPDPDNADLLPRSKSFASHRIFIFSCTANLGDETFLIGCWGLVPKPIFPSYSRRMLKSPDFREFVPEGEPYSGRFLGQRRATGAGFRVARIQKSVQSIHTNLTSYY